MHKFYKHILLSISLSLIIGCQPMLGLEDKVSFTPPQSDDTTVTTAVLEAMLVNENTATLTVHVETTNGIVTLSGYVKTIRQSDTSEEVARKTPGVKSVQNNIVVRK